MFDFTFENSIVKNGTYYSRYIASWLNEGGQIKGNRTQFMKWLTSVGCTDEEAKDIYNMATNGKLELESNAKWFIKNWIDDVK